MVYRVIPAAELDEERQEAEEKNVPVINPQLQAPLEQKEQIVEVPGACNSVYVSRPKEVAAPIEEAAAHAKNEP